MSLFWFSINFLVNLLTSNIVVFAASFDYYVVLLPLLISKFYYPVSLSVLYDEKFPSQPIHHPSFQQMMTPINPTVRTLHFLLVFPETFPISLKEQKNSFTLSQLLDLSRKLQTSVPKSVLKYLCGPQQLHSSR